MVRISYQGVSGAHSEAAARLLLHRRYHYDESAIESIGYESFGQAFDALEKGQVDLAMIPIENNLGGSIHDNYDLLVRHDFVINAELQYRVSHCLLALPGQKLQDIHTVISHPQALAQSESFLKSLGPNVKSERYYDTAGAAKSIRDGNIMGTAAIASDLAANIYNLDKLAVGIEDEQDNITRFLLLSRASASRFSSSSSSSSSSGVWSASYKTSLVFTLPDSQQSGILFKALSVFALREISLSKVESRPAKQSQLAHLSPSAFNAHRSDKTKFQYLFFVDVEGRSIEEQVARALEHLAELAPHLRILGSFPVFPHHVLVSTPSISPTHSASSSLSLPQDVPQVSDQLRIGIVGLGTFGQFLANAFTKQGHSVSAWSRSDYTAWCYDHQIDFYRDMDDFISKYYDCIVFSVSILSFEATVTSFPFEKLLNSPLIIDVLSVKAHPKAVLLKASPPQVDILCTHPMFGPESAKHSWMGLPLVYDIVRVRDQQRCRRFLHIFQRQGCRMVPMTCERHDEYAAGSQFVTHTIGRVLSAVGVKSTPINTKGFATLLEVIENTIKDSFDLYKGLYVFNPYSRQQLDAIDRSLNALRKLLDNNSSSTASCSNSISLSLTRRVRSMNESKTIAIDALVKQLQSNGEKIISLNVGEPRDQPPRVVLEAIQRALLNGHTKYTAVTGTLELRTAICRKFVSENNLLYSTEQICVSNGAKQCIAQSILAFVENGDEVIVPSPYWVSYPDIVLLAGGTPIILPTHAHNNYQIDISDLEQCISERTKMLIICTPNNPTGGIYTFSTLQSISRVLLKYPNIIVISDEIYEHLIYDNQKHYSFASFEGMYERTLVINGFSKGYCMTGLRLGYVAGPKWMIQAITKIQSQLTSCASSISQAAGVAALTVPRDDMKYMFDSLNKNRQILLDLVKEIKRVSCATPLGAFYALLDISAYLGKKTKGGNLIKTSEELCMHLLSSYKVALVPGDAFGAAGCLRLSFAGTEEEVRGALSRLQQCLEDLD